jgi:hypothetical protein
MTDDGIFYTGATCPHCRKPVHLAGDVNDEGVEPSAGDVSICIKCGKWSVFTEGLQMRKPTKVEARELLKDEDVREANKRWRRLKQ